MTATAHRYCATCRASSRDTLTFVCPCGEVRCYRCRLTCGHAEHVVAQLERERDEAIARAEAAERLCHEMADKVFGAIDLAGGRWSEWGSRAESVVEELAQVEAMRERVKR
jgi:hypothetical protein